MGPDCGVIVVQFMARHCLVCWSPGSLVGWDDDCVSSGSALLRGICWCVGLQRRNRCLTHFMLIEFSLVYIRFRVEGWVI